MFSRQNFLCLLALALAGCGTSPGPTVRPSAVTSFRVLETNAVPVEPEMKAAHDASIPATARPPDPPVMATNAPTNILAAAALPGLWVDWTRWWQTHGRPALKVVAGSRRAECAGTAVYLGVEPRLLDGRIEVFRRDLDKTLEPLLAGVPVVPEGPRRIVIDPGHGGTNWGTRSITGNVFEKDLTLDWARRLKPLLEAKGWQVELTRTNDASLELVDRVARTELAGALLFVSLHFNSAFPQPEPNGIETYCLTPQGLPSNVTRDFADDATRAWPNNSFDAENLRLALRVHRRILAATGAGDRGVKKARFMGALRNQNRPAILIEGGYLSNPAEARRITTAAYRQKLAEAVAAALE